MVSFLAKGGYADVYVNEEEKWVEKRLPKIWSSNEWVQYTTFSELVIHQSCKDIAGCPELINYTIDDTTVSLRMPYYGITLVDHFSRLQMSERLHEIIPIMTQVIDTCQSLIENGIMHTDLKPSNILIHKEIVHIIDYNIISLQKLDDPSEWGEAIGTWIYCSPEIIAHYKPTDTSLTWSIALMILTLCYRFPHMSKHNRPAENMIGLRAFWKRYHKRMFEINDTHWPLPEDIRTIFPIQWIELFTDCLHWNPLLRPSLTELRKRLNPRVSIGKPKQIHYLCNPSMISPLFRRTSIHEMYQFCLTYDMFHLFSNQIMMFDRCGDIIDNDSYLNITAACIMITLLLNGDYIFDKPEFVSTFENVFMIQDLCEFQKKWIWLVGNHLDFQCWQKPFLIKESMANNLLKWFKSQTITYSFDDIRI